MVLAIADVIEDKGHDPASCLWIEAIDIAELPYRMCFLQLACRGLSGRVWRGNTLSMEMFESFTLPGTLGFLDKHGSPFATDDNQSETAVPPAESGKETAISLPLPKGEQMKMF
ncbi:hypothetical protein [Pelagibius sp. Alg239-R121]|uniref:hypothetical protein n=1 Tax=Pelagibius sp. Alg239-R121 TaxID=2993448 RepID=UPI0024A70555|nr:hypothetical protein [Pelagibius sp. Alg239-R121]